MTCGLIQSLVADDVPVAVQFAVTLSKALGHVSARKMKKTECGVPISYDCEYVI